MEDGDTKPHHVHLLGDRGGCSILRGLHELFLSGEFCDCVVVVASKEEEEEEEEGGRRGSRESFRAHR